MRSTCPYCGGAAAPTALCKRCEGSGSLSVATRIASLESELAALCERARRWYLPDGTFETLATPEDVIERRKEAAAELARLRKSGDRLAAAADIILISLRDRPAVAIAFIEHITILRSRCHEWDAARSGKEPT